jgi:acetyl-CoA acyltransferase 1
MLCVTLENLSSDQSTASVALYVKVILKLPHVKMYPRGGAIALGHPLGATGARKIVTAFSKAEKVEEEEDLVN